MHGAPTHVQLFPSGNESNGTPAVVIYMLFHVLHIITMSILMCIVVHIGSHHAEKIVVLFHIFQDKQRIAMFVLRAIDGFARSNDRAAPSMDPLIAHLSIDRAIIDRSRSHLSIAHYCACAIDGGNMLHVLWCETVLQLLRHY